MHRMFLALALLGAAAAAPAAEGPRAPDGQYADRANLFSAESARMIRIRQDFFTRATGCPLYVATLRSAEGAAPREKAQEIFTRWHAAEKRLPDETILLLLFAAEKTGTMVLGPSVPKESGGATSPAGCSRESKRREERSPRIFRRDRRERGDRRRRRCWRSRRGASPPSPRAGEWAGAGGEG
ncbi:MAG: hypothetical protein ABR610_13405 [Thermoanaerobaculia bacterium]